MPATAIPDTRHRSHTRTVGLLSSRCPTPSGRISVPPSPPPPYGSGCFHNYMKLLTTTSRNPCPHGNVSNIPYTKRKRKATGLYYCCPFPLTSTRIRPRNVFFRSPRPKEKCLTSIRFSCPWVVPSTTWGEHMSHTVFVRAIR